MNDKSVTLVLYICVCVCLLKNLAFGYWVGMDLNGISLYLFIIHILMNGSH